MTVLLVTYDLNKESQRPPIVETIKKMGSTCVKLSESSYAIKTKKTPKKVYEELKDLIDENDIIYVIPLRSPWMGYGYAHVNQWLDENLP